MPPSSSTNHVPRQHVALVDKLRGSSAWGDVWDVAFASERIPVFRERKTSLDQTPEAVVLYYSGAFAPSELGFAFTEHQVQQSPNGWDDKLRMCSRFMDWLANFPAYAQWHESVRNREDRFVIAYIDGRPEEARYHTAESFGSLPATLVKDNS